jgi:hypothetical protein
MSARARQSHRLAAELAEHFGVPVEFVYTGEPDRRGVGAWRVYWTNGPTPAVLEAEVARRATRYPAVDVEHLGWSRSGTDLARAAALLAWLPQHPDYFGYLDSLYVVDSAFDAVDFPERLDEPVLRRARALLQLQGWLSMTVLQQLAAHCAPGWEHAEQWLDELAEIAEGRAGGNVVDLAAARDRRDEQR